MNPKTRSDLPDVQLHLGLAAVVDEEAARQSLIVDTACDKTYFHEQPKQAFRIRSATDLENRAFQLPAGTVVVVAYLSPFLQSRTFIPPRCDESATVAGQTVLLGAHRRSCCEWLGDLAGRLFSPQLSPRMA